MKKKPELKPHEIDLTVKVHIEVRKSDRDYLIYVDGKSVILPKNHKIYIAKRLPDDMLIYHNFEDTDKVLDEFLRTQITSIFNQVIKMTREAKTIEKVKLS